MSETIVYKLVRVDECGNMISLFAKDEAQVRYHLNERARGMAGTPLWAYATLDDALHSPDRQRDVMLILKCRARLSRAQHDVRLEIGVLAAKRIIAFWKNVGHQQAHYKHQMSPEVVLCRWVEPIAVEVGLS